MDADNYTEAEATKLSSRRRFLATAGIGGFLVASGEGINTEFQSATAGMQTPDCVLTPAEIEGPFYKNLSLIRRDITDGKPGEPLNLILSVVDASRCLPISNAIVDVWHADAGGLYSAFPRQGDEDNVDTSSQSFLRGIQTTNFSGRAMFDTIYPGWYRGRTTHVHVKIYLDHRTLVTTQLYFPDEISTAVYKQPAYVARGDKDTSNVADDFNAETTALRMRVERQSDGYSASLVMGINRQSI